MLLFAFTFISVTIICSNFQLTLSIDYFSDTFLYLFKHTLINLTSDRYMNFKKNVSVKSSYMFSTCLRPVYMKFPLKRECNTTFDVTITGLTFSQNSAHYLVIQHRLYTYVACVEQINIFAFDSLVSIMQMKMKQILQMIVIVVLNAKNKLRSFQKKYSCNLSFSCNISI